MVAVAIVVNKGKHEALKIEVKAGWAPSTTSLPTPAVTTQGYSDRLLENEPSVPGLDCAGDPARKTCSPSTGPTIF